MKKKLTGLGGRGEFFFEKTDEQIWLRLLISERPKSLRTLIILNSGQDPYET